MTSHNVTKSSSIYIPIRAAVYNIHHCCQSIHMQNSLILHVGYFNARILNIKNQLNINPFLRQFSETSQKLTFLATDIECKILCW